MTLTDKIMHHCPFFCRGLRKPVLFTSAAWKFVTAKETLAYIPQVEYNSIGKNSKVIYLAGRKSYKEEPEIAEARNFRAVELS